MHQIPMELAPVRPWFGSVSASHPFSQPSNSCTELWSAEARQAVDRKVWVGGRGANMNHAQRAGVREH